MTNEETMPEFIANYSDDYLKEMMKACQREYQKRFGQKDKNEYKISERWKVGQNIKDVKPYTYSNVTIPNPTPTTKDFHKDLFDQANKLEEELKQRTNNRDHYKALYEEQKKLAEDRLKVISDYNVITTTNRNSALQKENEKLMEALKNYRNSNDKLRDRLNQI